MSSAAPVATRSRTGNGHSTAPQSSITHSRGAEVTAGPLPV